MTVCEELIIKCPSCGEKAKKARNRKYPNWYYCTNPSCNRVSFEVKPNDQAQVES